MQESIVVAHRIPGRMRLRIPGKRGDPHYFEQFSEACKRLDDVASVRVNPGTGSVTVEFNGTEEQLLAQLRERCDVRIDEPASSDLSGNVPRVTSQLPPFHLVTGHDINPMFMTAAALAALSLVQLTRGKILAPSVTLLWYAIGAYRQSRNRA